MKTRNYANEHSYFIPMIDAADIFKYSAAGTGLPLYKPYKKANGSSPMRADKDLFSSTFRFCLETAELELTYGALKKGNFSQSVDDEIMLNGCTDALVCVTFDYAFREYNKFKWDKGRKGTLYVRAGYAYKDGEIIDKVGNKYEIALCARLHSNMYKIHNTSVQNAISRETLSFFRSVRQENLSPADILALINHIDKKGKEITEVDWLLLAALCNSGTGGEMDFSRSEGTKLYGMLKKNPPEADYDPDGIRKELYRMFGV